MPTTEAPERIHAVFDGHTLYYPGPRVLNADLHQVIEYIRAPVPLAEDRVEAEKVAQPLALALLERLDILRCIEHNRVSRAQIEVTAIIAHAFTTFAARVRAEQESSCQSARWLASVVWLHYHNATFELDPLQQKHLELAIKAGAPYSQSE